MLQPWATGHPGSGEGRAEVGDPRGSLASRGHWGISPRPLGLSCTSSHTQSLDSGPEDQGVVDSFLVKLPLWEISL